MGYAEDEKWADITPLEAQEGPAPIVPIAYTSECE